MCASIPHSVPSAVVGREFLTEIVAIEAVKRRKGDARGLHHLTSNESRWPRTRNPRWRTVQSPKALRSQRTSLARALLRPLNMAATISTSRFAALSASASVVASRLSGINEPLARECHTRIMTIYPRLRAERFAAARAMELLTAAKAAARRDKAAVKSHIDAALHVGEFFDWADICDFVHQRKAISLTMDGLEKAFRARGADGEKFASRFTQAIERSVAVAAELTRATAEYARATAAFTAEYRALAAAIAFGRAVLADLGVEVPRIADAKRGFMTTTAVSEVKVARTDADVAAASAADRAVTEEPAADVEPEPHTSPSHVGTVDERPNVTNATTKTTLRDRPAYPARPRGPAADRNSSSPTARCATRTRTATCATPSSGPCRW